MELKFDKVIISTCNKNITLPVVNTTKVSEEDPNTYYDINRDEV